MIRTTPLALVALLLAPPAAAQLEYEPLDEPEAAASQATAPEIAPGDPSDPAAVAAFAEQLNAAIVACFEQTLDEEGRATQAALTGRGMSFSDVAPQAVRDLANVDTMGGARFTQWGGVEAVIWLVAYTRAPACRLMVAETRLAQAARDGVATRLVESGLWTRDAAQSAAEEGVRREVFFLNTGPDAPNRLLLSITGPAAIERNGDGLQMLVTIAAVPGDQAESGPILQPEAETEEQGR